MIGHGLRRMPPLARIAAVAGGGLLFLPPGMADRVLSANLAGAALAGVVLLTEIALRIRPAYGP